MRTIVSICLIIFAALFILGAMLQPPTNTSNSDSHTQGFQFLPPAHTRDAGPDLHLAPQKASPEFARPVATHVPAGAGGQVNVTRTGQPVGIHPIGKLFVSFNCFPVAKTGQGITLCAHTLPYAMLSISVMNPDLTDVNDAALGCCIRADRFGNASWSFIVHFKGSGAGYYSVTAKLGGQTVSNDFGMFFVNTK